MKIEIVKNILILFFQGRQAWVGGIEYGYFQAADLLSNIRNEVKPLDRLQMLTDVIGGFYFADLSNDVNTMVSHLPERQPSVEGVSPKFLDENGEAQLQPVQGLHPCQ